jgi:hypothetical protein
MRRVVSVASVVVSLFASTSAWGISLNSPFVSTTAASYAQCNVTNVGTVPASVAVDLRDYFGTPVGATFNDCTPGPLPTRATCTVTAPAGADVYCSIASSSVRIRAVLSVYDATSNDIKSMIAATK